MSEPAISVILPAYNCGRFVGQAIESILQQTFTNFELIIINDGSTDNTSTVIRSFDDSRIRSVDNNGNNGLIYSLNHGIDLATGKYIARMDADDICLPHRFKMQYDWLEQRAHVMVVASMVDFIDEQNTVTSGWALDKKTISAKQIRRTMPQQNCVAHPSVMIRSHIVKAYRYAADQQHIEDYDLWLRLLADGFKIEKVPEVLLHYRIHNASITKTKLQNDNPFFKQLQCKRRFLLQRLQQKKAGLFEIKVAASMLLNLAVGIAKEGKKLIKK